jgi:S-adenosylmethionine:tRNA ribosyltransferase-isomerase
LFFLELSSRPFLFYIQYMDQYTYTLPPEFIARVPAEPRDASRLFIYNTATDEITFDRFSAIARHIPANALMVLNETKVLPARVVAKRHHVIDGHEHISAIELLFLINEDQAGEPSSRIRAMVDRKLCVGDAISIEGERLQTVAQDKNIFTFIGSKLPKLYQLLMDNGTTPIPKYIGDSGLSEQQLRTRYQTVFASSAQRDAKSIAAPTASLHFTEKVFESLDRAHIERTTLTLHVGMGTFAPVTQEQIDANRLHREWYTVSEKAAEAIAVAKQQGRPIVAVGTTATRALESYAASGIRLGSTELFIHPPYAFASVDALITNFHVPRSSLMALVDAFLKHKKARRSILDLYAIAIREGFRFYSFGDAMLIV